MVFTKMEVFIRVGEQNEGWENEAHKLPIFTFPQEMGAIIDYILLTNGAKINIWWRNEENRSF